MKKSISIIFISLILLPNIYLYFINYKGDFLLLAVLSLIYLGSFFKNSRWIGLFIPLYMLLPIIIGYIYYYKMMPEEQVFNIILETNWQEVSGYIGNRIECYIFLISVWTSICLYFLYVNTCYPLRWNHRSRYWILVAGTIGLLITLSPEYSFDSENNQNFEKKDTFLAETKAGLSSEIEKTYPFGFFLNLYDMYYEQNKINSAYERNSNFKFNSESDKQEDKRQVVILVIGETSRRNNWQINGYSRNTNPFLSQQPNLVNLKDMISASSVTRTSVPIILTRKPAKLVNKFEFSEKSVITAFKEAGFHTYWISTQQKFGAYDTSTSVYAKEADDMIFLNNTNYTNHGETDEVVLPVFKKVLNSKSQKIFIVIHTLGSHFNYSHRYPLSYDIFKPSLNDLDNYSLQDRQYKQQLINSYDNSILYTDYVLNELIENMDTQKNTESFLLYSSDHGEDLFDGECDKTGHGNDTTYNFEVASFAWYSDKFANANSKKVYNLKENSRRKINHTSIFPTLIDAADIRIKDETLDRSILGEFKDYQRYVIDNTDYDAANPYGPCNEIK